MIHFIKFENTDGYVRRNWRHPLREGSTIRGVWYSYRPLAPPLEAAAAAAAASPCTALLLAVKLIRCITLSGLGGAAGSLLRPRNNQSTPYTAPTATTTTAHHLI